jgi:hypothetical protein
MSGGDKKQKTTVGFETGPFIRTPENNRPLELEEKHVVV